MRQLILIALGLSAAVAADSATRAGPPVLTPASAAAAAEALNAWAEESRPSPIAEADLTRLETAVIEIETLVKLNDLDEAAKRWTDANTIRKGIAVIDRKRLGGRLDRAERRLQQVGVKLLENLVLDPATAAVRPESH